MDLIVSIIMICAGAGYLLRKGIKEKHCTLIFIALLLFFLGLLLALCLT